MELKEYIKSTITGSKRGLTRVLNTLTQQELMWRPASGCNSMGLLLFHIARSEDSFVQSSLQGKPQVWNSGEWCKICNLGEDETGSHYTVDQVNEFQVPEMKDLLAYYDAVQASTLGYLDSLTPDEFDRKVKMPFGEFTVSGIFSLVVSHAAQHIGEISFLRGMLRGMDK
ncbi:MAG: DinB family protein [Dehalococcoidales bacterium]